MTAQNVESYKIPEVLATSATVVDVLDGRVHKIEGNDDVSGDETISAYDAALILQYVMGTINRFPVEN